MLDQKRRDIALDPQLAPSILVKNQIENQVQSVADSISPTPVTSQLDGLRIKLDYDKYNKEIENVEVNDKKLKNIAEIKKSFMYDYILVNLLSESSIV
jgi:methyl coenzyme M reductase subunit C-like uncharacterized protein (methanogenesis marker protein 7)